LSVLALAGSRDSILPELAIVILFEKVDLLHEKLKKLIKNKNANNA
tara:strand:- start:261 stop:398 length:138 start_codon:yes stop_codon:yes gene_type:complete